MHTPVLLDETLEALRIERGRLYIDATVGEGGHFKKILEKGGRVLGIDWDEKQIENLDLRIKNENAVLVTGNFKNIEKIAEENGFYPVDGVLFDLGLSYGQIEKSGRGFSYKQTDDLLDMRLSLNIKTKASDLINSLSEEELYDVFAKNSEEINSRAISQTIVGARRVKKIVKVADLIKAIKKAIGRDEQKILARIFQALRIEVNKEFKNLKMGLKGSLKILRPGGKIVVISFHSLEGRIIKKFIQENRNLIMEDKLIKSKSNMGFERSAQLRVIVKAKNENS